MSVIILNMNMPSGCQKCKFFRKHLFGNGLDYSYSCMLGAKDFPMPWIRQMEERASDCPLESLEQNHCEDEYIKVPKKALKYRTAGMVAYNVEWLKNHFDIERAVIYGDKV